MRSIIRAEWKRVLPFWIWILFAIVIFVYTVYDNGLEKNRYTYVDADGNLIDGGDVIKDARQDEKASYIESVLLQGANGSFAEGSLNFVKAQNIADMNYGRQIEELTEEEINDFYQKRLAHIRQALEESSIVSYDRQEIDSLIEKASQMDAIVIGYAEGWSSLNRGMDNYIPFLLLGISMILIPLFGEDSKTNMRELILAAKRGRMPLDFARIITAFGAGSLLYLFSVTEYAFIKFINFGFEGGSLYIQGDESMLFSVYPISYIQQFVHNCGIGYLALLVEILVMLFVCILIRKAIACSAALCFFWIFLLVGEQMNIYVTNHCFFNFMPYRMAKFQHYYLENDLYRIGGVSISSMTWTACVAAIIVMAVMGIIVLILRMQQKEKGRWHI